jgi:tetratricopeptide (TPR) repeat protein
LLVNNYVFSELGSKSASYLNEQFNKGAYDDITHPRGFVKRINNDLKKIQSDKHVRVQFISPDQEKLQKQDPFLARLLNINEKAIDNYGLHEVKILENNVGYINIRSFEPVDLAASKVNSVMHFLEDTDALIIDLRYNHGGNPAMVQYICSHFFEQPTHLNSCYWRRGDYIEEFWTLPNVQGRKRPDVPMYILTSSNTFSAGEEFAYNLQALNRATIIGETTRGGANPGYTFNINQRFSIFLPTGMPINPITKTNWEGVGVAPDIKIEAGAAIGVALDKARQAAKKFRAKKNEEAIDFFMELKENLNRAASLLSASQDDSAKTIINSVFRQGLDSGLLAEYSINSLGYKYLSLREMPLAVALFEFNVNQYSQSSNAYDSLAEAFYKSGDKENAIINYKKSLQLDPNNQNALYMLDKMGINRK